MRTHLVLILAGAISILTSACATSDQWEIWKDHSSHFASGEHLVFSIRNREGTAPQVAKTDVATASAQRWWGEAITVSQEQILER